MAVDWNQGPAMASIRAAVMRGVVRWGTELERESVRLILETQKSGRVYRRRGVEHRASAPGEPPASDTGRLVNSRQLEFFEPSLMARLTFSTAYAAYLQFGTRKMEPRPWVDKALENTRASGLAAIREELRSAA